MELFTRAWDALLSAVEGVSAEDFAWPSGCRGWLVRDLACHLVIGAQDVLITLVTPTGADPTRDAVTYWTAGEEAEPADEAFDGLVVRLAAAYGEARLLKFHLGDLGAAAGRAARLADPEMRVRTQDMVLTAADFLGAYVLEWTLHHLDLIAHLPGAPQPPAETLARSREMLERLAGVKFPAALSDVDVLRIATGRRSPTAQERKHLGDMAAVLPISLG